MKIGTSTASFRSCTLEQAATIARALGFEALDLDGALDTQLSREKVLTGDPAEVQRVKALDLVIPNLMWTFKEFSLTPAVNDPDPAVRIHVKDQFRRVVEFCHQIGARSVLILPGILHPKQTVDDARKLSAQTFRDLLPIAQNAGVALVTEAHLGSAFESPKSALRLLQDVPGLGLTHDYAHFICQGYTQDAADILIPYTVHVHLRQAKNGLMQTPLEGGTINFARILDELRQVNYTGYLCVEYVHQNYLGADNVDVVTETVKMRDFLQARL